MSTCRSHIERRGPQIVPDPDRRPRLNETLTDVCVTVEAGVVKWRPTAVVAQVNVALLAQEKQQCAYL